MNRKYTHGNAAELVIIGVLVLAVAGLLVWKFVGGKSSTSDTTSTNTSAKSSSTTDKTTPAIALVDGSIDSSFETTLSFKYPSTWKYAQTMSGTIETNGSWLQKITITSPSGKYVVQYQVGAGGGIGGVCVPEETGTIASVAYEVVTGFTAMSYVELTYENMPTGQDMGDIALIDSSKAKSLKVGDSTCAIGFSGVKELASKNYVSIMRANLSIADATTASQIKAALSGSEYDQAKAILLSTVH